MGAPKVCVLMSTFNGDKYLDQQIRSILQQNEVLIQLIIRDDGSSDTTIKILDSYASQFNNVSYYVGDNVGVGKSFFDLLLKAPDADYYAFSDQDDYWLDNKVSKAVESIETECNITESGDCQLLPVLYTSNQTIVDEGLNIIDLRYHQTPNHSLISTISDNKLSGCTMVFNDALKNIITNTKYSPSDETLTIRFHDTWMVIVANIFGKVLFDSDSYILYRQHEANVVGARALSFVDRINDKIKRFKSKKYKGQRSRLSKEVLVLFSDVLSDKQRMDISLIANCNSLIGFINLIKSNDVRSIFKESTLLLFLKCLTGWV